MTLTLQEEEEEEEVENERQEAACEAKTEGGMLQNQRTCLKILRCRRLNSSALVDPQIKTGF